MRRETFLVLLISGILASGQDCGINKYRDPNPQNNRIVGGRIADPGEVPWQVSLMLNHPLYGPIKHFCGGVILSEYWILSAAHCFLTDQITAAVPQYWTVRVGELLLGTKDPHEQWHNVSGIYYKFEYHGNFNNDIALIKLKEPIKMNEDVQPVCLPNPEDDYTNKTCWASGWGKIAKDRKISDRLKVVSLKIISNDECHRPYITKLGVPIKRGHICAGTQAGEGTCQGDSGGPLSCLQGITWYLVGLTSFGYGCAEPGFPGVYTRVSAYLPWIRSTMNQYV